MTARTLRASSPTLWLGTLALAVLAAALLWLGGCDAFPPDPPDPPDPDPPPAACEFPPVEFRLCEEAEGCNDPIWAPFFTDPAWHPDGRYLAAVHADSIDTDADCRYDGYVNGIWLLDTETGGKRPLLEGDFAEPDWSPDGRHLALSDLAVPQIYTVEVADLDSARVDLSTLRQLTTENTNFAPAWSPDGQRIAFTSYRINTSGDLWVIGADGSGEAYVAPGFEPEWNATGDSLIYIDYLNLYGDLARISVSDPSSYTRLTCLNEPQVRDTFLRSPQLSSDDQRIVFWGLPDTGEGRFIYVLEGSHVERLEPNDALEYFTWNPNSNTIAFVRSQNVPERWSGQLYTMARDGSDLTQLSDYFPAWGRCPGGC